MHLDVVAVLVVFCIAFTVSLRSDTSNNEFLPQPLRHMRRHHRHDERYVAKNKDRNRNSNSNNNHRHPNNNDNNNNNKNGNRKRGRQMSTSRHGHQQHGGGGEVLEHRGGTGGGPMAFPSTLLHNSNTNNNNYNRNNGGGGGGGGEVIPGVGGVGGTVVECCPSETRMVELSFGISRNNTLLEIYNNASKPQRFYEVVCAANVTNRMCRYVDAALQPYSSCVERYTYTYAIVRDVAIPHNVHQHHVHRADSSAEWRLDYIRISSGCYCEFRNVVNR